MEDRAEISVIPPAFPGLPTEMAIKILSELDNRSLFSCRLVSRGWCQVSSTILQDRPSVTVRPCCPPDPERKKLLSNLIKCFKKSRKFTHPFPYTNFVIRGDTENILKGPDIKAFFALSKQPRLGPYLLIKSLCFEYPSTHPVPLSKLERLIVQGAPHLRILCLKFMDEWARIIDEWVRITRGLADGPRKVSNNENNSKKTRKGLCTIAYGRYSPPEKSTLPSLEVLQLKTCDESATVELVTRILRAAPNLQKIEGAFYYGSFKGYPYSIDNPEHLQPLIDANKLHLVQQCEFKLSGNLVESGLVTREKLSGFQPKVLNLRIEVNDDEIQQKKSGLREILWTVKDIVEELGTDSGFSLLDNLDLLRFSKLRTWNLSYGKYPIFPPGMRNRDPFPKLENICIYFGYKESDGTVFPSWRNSPILSIPSAHKLEITLYYPFASQEDTKECFESMAFMCPNVRNMDLKFPFADTVDFTGVAPHIWTNMNNLQTLTLCHLTTKIGLTSVERMEAGFTGFSMETVHRIEATRSKKRPKVEKVEHLRVNPSILQMTALKKLRLSKNLLEKSQPSAPFLPLSFKYAFNLMPGLVVEIF